MYCKNGVRVTANIFIFFSDVFEFFCLVGCSKERSSFCVQVAIPEAGSAIVQGSEKEAFKEEYWGWEGAYTYSSVVEILVQHVGSLGLSVQHRVRELSW